MTPLLLLCVVPLATPVLSGASGASGEFGPVERIERHLGAMGTTLRVTVEAPTRRDALLASEAAVRAIESVERRLSTWSDESELAALNRAPLDRRFALSTELAADLQRARDAWVWSDGAFDPAVGALVELWGLRAGGRDDAPDARELRAALVPSGLGALELGRDDEGSFAFRRHPALRLEEGGFGKGVGLDAGTLAFASSNATFAVLDLGGQVALYSAGSAEDGPVFEIADPRDRARGVVSVRPGAGSFATSGNSERAVVVDGRRHGHLLDPRTGRPVPDFGSITVFAVDATTADLLSTALYVLGPERALERATSMDGVEVLVLDTRADELRVCATRGLAGRIVADTTGGPTIDWHRPAPRAVGTAGAGGGVSSPATPPTRSRR